VSCTRVKRRRGRRLARDPRKTVGVAKTGAGHGGRNRINHISAKHLRQFSAWRRRSQRSDARRLLRSAKRRNPASTGTGSPQAHRPTRNGPSSPLCCGVAVPLPEAAFHHLQHQRSDGVVDDTAGLDIRADLHGIAPVFEVLMWCPLRTFTGLALQRRRTTLSQRLSSRARAPAFTWGADFHGDCSRVRGSDVVPLRTFLIFSDVLRRSRSDWNSWRRLSRACGLSCDGVLGQGSGDSAALAEPGLRRVSPGAPTDAEHHSRRSMRSARLRCRPPAFTRVRTLMASRLRGCRAVAGRDVPSLATHTRLPPIVGATAGLDVRADLHGIAPVFEVLMWCPPRTFLIFSDGLRRSRSDSDSWRRPSRECELSWDDS
jgi:hypothetical protein